MDLITSYLAGLAARVAALPLRWKLVLGLLVVVIVGELVLSRLAPRSRFYAGWKAFFEAVGDVWTAVLLSIVYVVSVGPVSLVSRLAGRDPLDSRVRPEPSFWRRHEPNPLGPQSAARHQF